MLSDGNFRATVAYRDTPYAESKRSSGSAKGAKETGGKAAGDDR